MLYFLTTRKYSTVVRNMEFIERAVPLIRPRIVLQVAIEARRIFYKANTIGTLAVALCIQWFPQKGGRGRGSAVSLFFPLLSRCTHQKTVYPQCNVKCTDSKLSKSPPPFLILGETLVPINTPYYLNANFITTEF